MSFEEFEYLFHSAIKIAVKNAEELLEKTLPSEVKIVLHGAGYSGELVNPYQAAKILYLGEKLFYKIIDLSVVKVNKTENTLFVRASSHTPITFDQTWNNPPGSGPFKQLISQQIEIEESS